MHERHMTSAYRVLRVAFGVVPIVAGLDKFLGLLANWQGYLSPIAIRLLPVAPATFLRAAGVVEIVVGVGILAGKARVFGFIAAAWLAAIALELVTTGHFLDVAARDAVLAVSAYALGRLAQVEEVTPARAPAPATRAAEAHG